MISPHDPLDLSILYDTARGFLGLGRRSEVVSHLLLALIGISGAGFAGLLRRGASGSLVPEAVRGICESELILPWSQGLEKALASDPGPRVSAELETLGERFARTANAAGVEMVMGVAGADGLAGIVALGPRLLGDTYGGREISMVREIVEMASRALDAGNRGIATTGAGRGHRRRLEALRRRYPVLDMIKGEGASTLGLLEELVELAEYDLPILIHGETGTGKELVAQALHGLGPRSTEPFEAINCAAIPRELIASALFGHERGAFTGAVQTVRGAFERAGEGTIFLDEIGDMPMETQASLLRVLQERRFRRVGGEKLIPASARVISATNKDLVAAVDQGEFRPDLFYRIRMYAIETLPLRSRPEEIPVLARHFLDQHRPPRREPPELSPEFIDALGRRRLSGNARELESLVIGAMVSSRSARVLLPEHLPADDRLRDESGREEGWSGAARGDRGGDAGGRDASARDRGGRDRAPRDDPGGDVLSYEDMEREYIRQILRLTEGNKSQAAALMKIPRTTLTARMKKLGIEE